MNERIKELAEQAGLLPKEIGPVVETRHLKKKQQDLEKFAKLIVRECVDHLELEYGQSALTGNAAARSVKKHFGVEQ